MNRYSFKLINIIPYLVCLMLDLPTFSKVYKYTLHREHFSEKQVKFLLIPDFDNKQGF